MSTNSKKKKAVKPVKLPLWRAVLHTVGSTLRSKKFWKRFVISLAGFAVFFMALSYGVARWYQHTQAGKPYSLGVTYIDGYARSFGLNPHETYLAILNDLGVKQLRLVSYWDVIEPVQGKFDFRELDWQMKQAQKHGATVSLSVGLRQPRWPECHAL